MTRSIIDEFFDIGGNEYNKTDRNVITESIEKVAKPIDTKVSNWDNGDKGDGGFGYW